MESRLIKILAIDDNPDNLLTIQALVNEAFPNVMVLKALNGIQGLESAAKENPDVILLDIVMPDMDGYEVCEKLKADKNLRDIPVLFITAIKGDKESRIKALECGAEAFLAKPIDESELIAQIRAMVKIKNANIERHTENKRLAALVNEQTSELKKSYTATLNLLEDLKNENDARKKTEEALRESEELYRSVLQASPDSIVITDLEGNVRMVSQATIKFMACEKEEDYLGHNLNEFILYKDRERAAINIRMMFNGIFNGPHEYQLVKMDKTTVFTEIKAEFVRNLDEQPRSIVFAIRDITERNRAQEALRESEEKFRNMANLLPQIVFELDTNWKITYINEQARSILKYNGDSLIGINSYDLHVKDQQERIKNNLQNVLAGESTENNEFNLVRGDGTVFPALIYINSILKNGKAIGIRGLVVDITHQKLVEEKLRVSEEKFRDMANLLPQIIFETDINGCLTYVNKQAYILCGYNEDDNLIGKDSKHFIIPEDREKANVNKQKRFSGELKGSSVYLLKRKNGSTFPALLYSNAIYKENIPIGMRGIIVDITEQKKAEEKISHVARLYALLSHINQATIHIQNLPDLFQKICEVAIEYGQFKMAWVGVYDEETNIVNSVVHSGNENGYLENIHISTESAPECNGPVAMAIKGGEIIHSNDIESDILMLPWRTEALNRGYRSMGAVPLNRKGKIFATLNLYSSEKNFFSFDEQKLLQEIGDDISFAINAIDTENLRNQTENALKQSRNELKTIYDYAPVMMCVVDINRHVLFANKAFSIFTGISQTDMTGRAVGGVVGCTNSLKDPRGCGYSPKCWDCSLRIAMDKTFNTSVGLQDIEYHSTLNIEGLEREVSLLGSTAIISNEDKKNLLLCLHDITGRKLIEDALQKSEMLLRTFIDNSPFEIWARDINSIGILENKKSIHRFGSIIGKTPKKIRNSNTEIIQTWNKNNERVLNGEMVDEEHEITIHNSSRIFQQIVFPIKISEKTIGIAGFNIDITERKQAEDALIKNNSRLELAMKVANMAWWEMDMVTGNVLFGKRKTEMLGYESENFIHYKDFMDLVHPDDYAMVMNAMRKLINGEDDKYETEYRILTKSGDYKWFYDLGNISNRDENGKPVTILGLVLDITYRKTAEKELYDQKQFFEQMFMQSSLSTQILDVNGWCERINPKLSQLFGVNANEMEGKVYNIFQDAELKRKAVLPKLEKVFQKGKSIEWEILFDIGTASDSQNIPVKDKKKVWFNNWAYPIFDQNGTISHVIIQHLDTSARKMAEEALSKSQEQLKKFASHLQNVREEERVLLAREIHDELGQILIAIKIDMGMLKQNVLKGINKNYSEQIIPKFDVLFGLVDNTIKTARKIMTDLRPEVLDLLGFIETIKQHLNSFQERFKINCIFENSITSIELDAQKSVALFRIIQEALNNVAKHSKATELKVILELKDDKFSLEIVDNGIGFDEKHKKNFDSYGIIGMKERVFLLDGELTITAKINHGTSVKVVMPYIL